MKCSYNRDLLKYSLSFFNLVVKSFFPLKKEGVGGGLQERGTFMEDVQHNDFIAMSVFHVKHLLVCTWFVQP